MPAGFAQARVLELHSGEQINRKRRAIDLLREGDQMNNVRIGEPGSYDAIEEVDEDECDGWGPIRARRPSVPSIPDAPLRTAPVETERGRAQDTSTQRTKR
jgi:hypothetical protein